MWESTHAPYQCTYAQAFAEAKAVTHFLAYNRTKLSDGSHAEAKEIRGVRVRVRQRKKKCTYLHSLSIVHFALVFTICVVQTQFGGFHPDTGHGRAIRTFIFATFLREPLQKAASFQATWSMDTMWINKVAACLVYKCLKFLFFEGILRGSIT